MSYITEAFKQHKQRETQIMERVNNILNDYQEIYDIISNEGNTEQFISLVNTLKGTIPEKDKTYRTLINRATRFDTTGYRVSYSGNDPLRINAADDYNRKQREHDAKEINDDKKAKIEADKALKKVEAALVAVEKFLKDYETELAPYYQRKKEEKRQKVLEEARAEAEKRQAEKLIKDKKKKVRIISAIISLCLTIALFFIPVFGKLMLDNFSILIIFGLLCWFGIVYYIVWLIVSAVAKTH